MSVNPHSASKRRVIPTKPRRGATIVLVAIVMTVLIMFGAFGIDFARMYSFQAQVKVLTDAASMAGAIELVRGGDSTSGTTRALALKSVNKVEGSGIATMADSNIVPGKWDFSTNSFNATGIWSGATAIRARARYTANWTLAKMFGVSTRTLTQTSIAALGSQVSSSCMKPFAIPYLAVLTVVGKAAQGLSYTLTAADLNTLKTPQPFTWNMSGSVVSASTPPGSFSLVQIPLPGTVDPKDADPTKKEYYNDVIPPGCSDRQVHVGDVLPAITGVAKGTIQPAMELLCPNAGKKDSWTCPVAVTFQVPIYNLTTDSGNNGTYKINYIGSFTLTGVDFQGSKSAINGYLTVSAAQSGGGFSPTPGPISMAVIVQ